MIVEDFIRRIRASKLKRLFHFTDERNVDSIKREGLLSWAEIQRRRLNIVPGGNAISHKLDAENGLDDYVHLCLCDEHGMAHQAEQQGRIGKVHWIGIDPAVASWDGVRMTDDNSAKTGVGARPIADMLPLLDLDTLYDYCDWKDQEIQARRRTAKRYELLVPRGITMDYLTF